ncbi:branched-chain amino acid ABC transporter permease [Rhizobium rhizogenes]|uniref:Branched-chain amino acid ABC transporter permease n=2 Tax=Rhizobium/Agrobacterium group TaxID=227290 RepID=A0AB36EQ84_AGRTU|nr:MULTISPECIES: AzlC family ABC transporter permease [Rhizobium/Agrobacterium group]KAA3507233.1 branched-chain amino acid ABC transporter permease [Agrobacterium tumefaciens]MDX8322905.1 AzlC family ABC transporter permease [Agrobacterium tumefaciens]NSY05849.1 AzlC family ABC transporter permease [Agrobacterium tumefaciens]NSY68520.1 AzlC family ABC transporter permease [Agrobacterium tumefaciens]NSZ05695.1 AzlC family ABC transporter permease [Agrobacterium tumefaciens]
MSVLEKRAELGAGLRAAAPLLVAMVPIGAVFGAVAVGKGLSPLEASLMSILVFAGGSQFVAMDLWTHPASWSALGFAALLVNLRHVLMSASIAGKLDDFTGWRKYAAMLVLTDESWALSEFRAVAGRLTAAFFTGAALPIYLVWNIATLTGALLGSVMGDMTVIGLDFAFPAVFIVLLMGFWKGRETGLVLLASAAAAFVTHALVPGAWYIAAGALAGLSVAAFGREDEVEQPA